MVVTCCSLTSIFKINLFWQDSLQILSFMAINTRLRHTFCQAYIQCKSMQKYAKMAFPDCKSDVQRLLILIET